MKIDGSAPHRVAVVVVRADDAILRTAGVCLRGNKASAAGLANHLDRLHLDTSQCKRLSPKSCSIGRVLDQALNIVRAGGGAIGKARDVQITDAIDSHPR